MIKEGDIMPDWTKNQDKAIKEEGSNIIRKQIKTLFR